MTPAARHAKLVREIEAHNYRYYVLDDPSVSDETYDGLVRDLRALEEAHAELVTDDSPTRRVGGEAREPLAQPRQLPEEVRAAHSPRESLP